MSEFDLKKFMENPSDDKKLEIIRRRIISLNEQHIEKTQEFDEFIKKVREVEGDLYELSTKIAVMIELLKDIQEDNND